MEGILGEMGSLKGSSPVSSCAVMAPTAHTSVAGSNFPLHASGAKYLHEINYCLPSILLHAYPSHIRLRCVAALLSMA